MTGHLAIMSRIKASRQGGNSGLGQRSGMTPEALAWGALADPPLTLFHASPSVNRESIQIHGLDVSRMSADGIAGSTGPEVEGVFLGEHVWDGYWYASFGHHASVDIWEVHAEGLSLQEDNEGWICGVVIPPERLKLIESDVTPEAAEAWLDAQTPAWLRGGVEDHSDKGFDGVEPTA